MRFINTVTFEFSEVSDLEVHELEGGYCILSHRWIWGEDEITYVDVLDLNSDVKAKKGYGKFAGACALAKELGYNLIWIDTCCINKSDAVELSEAINSMYRWYEMSAVCIAYLQDVILATDFKDSEWFTRGWTLQELIAPKIVKFYGRDWNLLGDKNGLSSEIVSNTKIPADVLRNEKHPHACSVAQRMSWAAKRTTKRLEDRAYSLMGLFDVNMPMIYGERDQAFLRLQEYIISKLSDESIFVWDLDLLEDSTRDAKKVHCGLLAPSPACFARSGDVVSLGRSRGFQINQFGLSISLPAIQYGLGAFQAALNAGRTGRSGQCAIFLNELPEDDLYARSSTSSGESTIITKEVASVWRDFTIPLKVKGSPPHLYPGFWLRRLDFDDKHISSYEIWSAKEPEFADRIRLSDRKFGTAGIIRLTLCEAAGLGWIKLGFDPESRPICFMTFPRRDGDKDHATRQMSDRAIKIMGIPSGSKNEGERHHNFNDEWTKITPQALPNFSSNSWDSRQQTGINGDHSFYFTFKASLFKISVSVKRAPDINYLAADRTGEIWAVDLVVTGTPPIKHINEHKSDCIRCIRRVRYLPVVLWCLDECCIIISPGFYASVRR
ncbi:HET-domain-containing protein [Xylaria curta]|nr:HET-domain-containing protein [Xylaria curta]